MSAKYVVLSLCRLPLVLILMGVLKQRLDSVHATSATLIDVSLKRFQRLTIAYKVTPELPYQFQDNVTSCYWPLRDVTDSALRTKLFRKTHLAYLAAGSNFELNVQF